MVGNNNWVFGSSSRRCTLWFADDHPVILDGLEGVFCDVLHRPAIQIFCSADSLLEKLQHQQNVTKIYKCTPDVIFLDCSMPGTSGIEAIQPILRFAPFVKIIMLTQYDAEGLIRRAFQQGAYGYVLKSSDTRFLLDALQTVMQGKYYIDPSLPQSMLKYVDSQIIDYNNKAHYGLTPIEMHVLQHLAKGLTRKQIAEEMNLSIDTIKTHLQRSYNKLGVHTVAAVLAKLYKERILFDTEGKRKSSY